MPDPTLGVEHLLPFERDSSTPSVDDLFNALGPDITGDPKGVNEPAPEEAAQAEPGGPEEGEEVEASTEGEPDGDDDPDEGDVEEPATPPVYKVKVDGEDVEVTLDELQKGYSRTADYTRKTQALAEKERTELAAYRSARDQYGQRLGQLERALADAMPEQEPDWDKLKAENPTEFAALYADHQIKTDKLKGVRAEQDRVRAEQERDYHAQMQEHLAAEGAKLLSAIPEWKDEAKAKAEKGKLVEFASGLGYTPEDLDNVHDHRLVLILRDAMRYRATVAKGAEVVKDAPRKPLKPGGRVEAPKRGRRTEIQRASDRLARTGRVEDAAALFENLDI